MPSYYLAPIADARAQFFDAQGRVLNGGLLYSYAATSTTPQNTYTDSTGGTANQNPIQLNSDGRTPSGVYLTGGVSYKFVLKDSAGNTLWTQDVIGGVNDTSSSQNEWVSGPTPTYISATSFSLVGDQTTNFHVGRRLKTTNTAGTIYSTILTSAFGALTTVTVENDSGTLDSGLSAISYGLISQVNGSDPAFTDQRPVVANITDRTKRVRVSASGLTTGKTRVLTVADQDFTLGPLPRTYIAGWTYQNAAGDVTNDIDIAAGAGMDSTNGYWIAGAASTKQLDAAWAVGTAAGGLDTGAIGNNDYYIWAIARSDTSVVDYLFSLSSTAPTMPANYSFKRLIGWFKRVGGVIVLFHTYETEGGGIELKWDAPTTDVSIANTLTTARRTDAVKVPLNFSTTAILTVSADDAGEGFIRIACPDETDAAVAVGNSNVPVHTVALGRGYQRFVRTSATGTVASRSSIATVDTYAIVTDGFRWARRN